MPATERVLEMLRFVLQGADALTVHQYIAFSRLHMTESTVLFRAGLDAPTSGNGPVPTCTVSEKFDIRCFPQVRLHLFITE